MKIIRYEKVVEMTTVSAGAFSAPVWSGLVFVILDIWNVCVLCNSY